MTQVQILHRYDSGLQEALIHTRLHNAEVLLSDCLFRSVEIRWGLINGKFACVWGLIPPTLLSHASWLWLMTTPLVEEHKFLFVRHSQRWLEEALKRYPEIIGDCITGNDRGRRWLTWLGAEFGATYMGRAPFVIRAKHG